MQERRDQNYANAVKALDALYRATTDAVAAGDLSDEVADPIFSNIYRDGLLLEINFSNLEGEMRRWLVEGVHLYADHMTHIDCLSRRVSELDSPAWVILIEALYDSFEIACAHFEALIPLATDGPSEALRMANNEAREHWNEEYAPLYEEMLAMAERLTAPTCAKQGCAKDR